MNAQIVMLVINPFTHDTRVQKEAKTVAARGYNVTVFALHDDNLAVEEQRDGYSIHRIQLASRRWGTLLAIRLLKYFEFCVRFINRAVGMQPAVIHAHDVNALIPAYIAAKMSRAKLVYDAHELWAERRNKFLKSSLFSGLVKFTEGGLARRSNGVITVNPSLAEYLYKQYGLAQMPVVLMHAQEYRAVTPNNVLRQEFNIPADWRIAIYPGTLTNGRGLELLIEAAPLLDRTVVVLMGKDNLSSKLQRLVAEHNLQDRVFIHKPVLPEDVSRYVASADVGVMPTQDVDLSYYYGAGNKLFHYMMAGIPAAVSNQPEKRRIVETYGIGAVFDQTDPHDMARVINQILDDKAEYQAMCRRARQTARDVFNWNIESRKLITLYDELLPTKKFAKASTN